MQIIIGVRFKKLGKVYYFDPKDIPIQRNDRVIVETSKGTEIGEVVIAPKLVDVKEIVSPVKTVLRKATEDDLQKVLENTHKECRARKICAKKIEEHTLEMKVINVEYSFDSNKAVFYFTAEGRVDFRNLVKELAGLLKVRIEMRQVGVRDEAKHLGGLGPCGRQLCCSAFLSDFEPVSIKMAKEQSLSLNPGKISGACGRLMCCLKYEHSCYEEIRSRMPKLNTEVKTPKGFGTVVEVNVLKEKVKVKVEQKDRTFELIEFALESIEFNKNDDEDTSLNDSRLNGEIIALIDK